MENNTANAYSEVYKILSFMEQKYIDMIPKKLINLIKDERNEQYEPNIQQNISLAEQNLQRKTLAVLAMLNLNYWCENEEEKKELLKIYAENDKKKEKELREKYNPDNLFKKKEQTEEESNNKEEVQMIEHKEQNVFKKILNKIMKFFKKG